MEKTNSRDNLIRLIDQYQNLVFSVCLKLTGDYFTAEDITQETFLAAYQHWDRFDGESEKAWLCRIAGNKCIDWRRAAARRNISTDPEEMPEIEASDEPMRKILNKEVMEQFDDCLKKLEEPYRSVAIEHFKNGKTAKAIALEKGMGVKTIQTQIYRAKEMLKKSIRKEDLL